MAALENPEVYEVLAGLARPYGDKQSVLDFSAGDNRKWLRRLSESTPFESVTIPVLGALSALVSSHIEQVIRYDVAPVLPPGSRPVSLDDIPDPALVRLGFGDLVNAVDEYYGDVHNRLLEGATHLGLWTVAISLEIAYSHDIGPQRQSS